MNNDPSMSSLLLSEKIIRKIINARRGTIYSRDFISAIFMNPMTPFVFQLFVSCNIRNVGDFFEWNVFYSKT